uniref:Uncharacterized protein n=1 Tax=Romanomermis culicivorax TaxID=13658 RepID=A0A915KJS4_ROMCU
MYHLYLESVAQGKKPASFQKYAAIFGQEYNLSFHRPKKDQCVECANFESLGENHPEKEALAEKQQLHIARKESSREAHKQDLATALEDESHVVVTMDLQSVLQNFIHMICDAGIHPAMINQSAKN